MMPRVPSWVPEGLLYAAVAFGPLAFGAVEPWSRALLELLCYALALACFLRGRPASTPPAAESLWLLPAAMAAYGVVQLLTPAAADGPTPLVPFTAAAHATERSLRLWTAYAALLWSVPRVLTGHEAARRFARFLFGLGMAVAAQGLLQKWTGGRVYWLRDPGGAYPFGPYFNGDHAGNFLMMCLGAGLGVFASMRRRWPAVDGTPASYLYSQARLGACVLLVFAGVLASGARGAFLAMPLSAAVLAFFGASFRPRAVERRLMAGGAVALLAAVLYMVFRHVGDSARAGALTESAVAVRFLLYADSWRLWRGAPLFGTGLGGFADVFPAYQDLGLRAAVHEAHSDWLQLAVETGLVGLAGAVAFLALLAHYAVRAWRAARSAEARALIGGAFASVLGFAFHSLFEFSFQLPANAAVFFALAGFLLSAPAWMDKDPARARHARPAVWAAALAAAGFLVLSLSALRPALAAAYAARHGTHARRADALARAHALEPDPARLRDLGRTYYRAAGEGEATDFALLRGALVRGLAASELRPYDSDALYLTGAALLRLGRAEDARAYLDGARVVRFSRRPRRDPAPGAAR